MSHGRPAPVGPASLVTRPNVPPLTGWLTSCSWVEDTSCFYAHGPSGRRFTLAAGSLSTLGLSGYVRMAYLGRPRTGVHLASSHFDGKMTAARAGCRNSGGWIVVDSVRMAGPGKLQEGIRRQWHSPAIRAEDP